MDCPIGLRIDSDASDEVSDDDDSETFEPEIKTDNENQTDRPMITTTDSESESESESDDDSDCSSDSEDGNSDGAAKASGNNEDASAPQAQCIQVILQNGRMINVNAERSNEQDNMARGPNALRCVIGIINGRGLSQLLTYNLFQCL